MNTTHIRTTPDGRRIHWIGTANSTNKNIEQGKETLIPKDGYDWGQHLTATTEFFAAPTLDNAHRAIIETYSPQHDIALFSLCTSTRPYSNSMKWSKFYDYNLHTVTDFIVLSSGGIIPMVYEDCYPFLNYDTPIPSPYEYEQDYFDVTCRKLDEFLRYKKYKYCLFLFKPGSRGAKIAASVCPKLVEDGVILDYYIGPSEEKYQEICDTLVSDPKLYSYRYNPIAYDPISYLKPVFDKWGVSFKTNNNNVQIDEWFNA